MAKGFKPVVRDQVFLLPPDMREWLPQDHLVWFLLDVIDSLDITAFEREYRLGGAGREAFDPRMMIALLTYAYCGGMRSSRAIEKTCHTDVAFRVVCAQQPPDHTVVARFRSRHAEALADLFAQVLVLCAKAGLGRVGVVAVDGTKVAANASLDRNRTEEWFREAEQQTRQQARDEAEAMLAEAAVVDAEEDAAEAAEGGPRDRLAPPWRDRSGRKDRIKAALEELQAYQDEAAQPVREAERRARQTREAYEQAVVQRAAKVSRERADAEQHRRRSGRPVDPDCEPPQLVKLRRRAERAARRADQVRVRQQQAPPRRANATDPQSRVMKTRQGWIQGYNAQTAVSEDGVILAVHTSNDPVDHGQLVPMMDAATHATEAMGVAAGDPGRTVGTVVADAGYFSEDNLQAAGPDRLIAAGKKYDIAGDDAGDAGARTTDGDPRRQACKAMVDRLRQPESVELYRRRAAIVEPVNAHLKDRRGLRRFSRRGLNAAAAEFTFAAWVTNLMKLHTAALHTG